MGLEKKTEKNENEIVDEFKLYAEKHSEKFENEKIKNIKVKRKK